MLRKRIYNIIAFIPLLFTLNSSYASSNSLTILAPQSISLALTDIIRSYSNDSKVIVTGSYDNASNLLSNIEEGLPADLIVTSHPDWIKELKQRGLIDVTSISNIAEDKLVVLANSEDKYAQRQKNFVRLFYKQYGRYNFVIQRPEESSLGKYAEQLLMQNSKLKSIPKKRISYVKGDIPRYLFRNTKTIGMDFYSKSFDNSRVSIIHNIHNKNIGRIVYQAAIIAGENMTLAKDFMEYLKSTSSKKVLKRYGFIIDEDE